MLRGDRHGVIWGKGIEARCPHSLPLSESTYRHAAYLGWRKDARPEAWIRQIGPAFRCALLARHNLLHFSHP